MTIRIHHTNVDFAGPLFVTSQAATESNDKVKADICLFTSASTHVVATFRTD